MWSGARLPGSQGPPQPTRELKFLIGGPGREFKGDVGALMDNLHELLGGDVAYNREHLVGRPVRTWLEITHPSRRRKQDAIAGLIRAELEKLGGGDVTVQLDT